MLYFYIYFRYHILLGTNTMWTAV